MPKQVKLKEEDSSIALLLHPAHFQEAHHAALHINSSTDRSVVCSQLKWIGCLGSEERGTQAAVFLNLSRTRDKNKYVMYEKYLKNLVL